MVELTCVNEYPNCLNQFCAH